MTSVAGADGDRQEPDDVAELLVPDRQVVGAGRDVLDVEVAVAVALADVHRVVGPLSLSATNGFVDRLAQSSRTSNGGQPCQLRAVPVIAPVPGAGERVGDADEAEPVGGAPVGRLAELLAGRAGAVAALLDAGLQLEPAVDRRGLVPAAVRVAVAAARPAGDVDEVRRRAEVVDLGEAVAASVHGSIAAAQRVVVVVDGDCEWVCSSSADVEAAQAGLLGVGRAVGPRVVVEHEDADLAERQRVRLALLGQVDRPRCPRVGGQRDVLAPHLVVERADGDQVAPGSGQACIVGVGLWSPSATIGLLLSVGARIGRSASCAALPRCALSALTM